MKGNPVSAAGGKHDPGRHGNRSSQRCVQRWCVFGNFESFEPISVTSNCCAKFSPLVIFENERTVANMWITLLVLLVIWVVLAIVGFTFQGLLWLAIIGIVLFVATLIFGIIRSRNGRRSA